MYRCLIASIVALAAWALAPAALAQVYKCTDAQGRSSYQSKPCDGRAKAEKQMKIDRPPQPVQPPATDAPPRNETGALAGARPAYGRYPNRDDDAQLVKLLLYKRECDQRVPGFAAQTKADYERWRSQNAAWVQRVEGSPQFARARVDYGDDAISSMPGAASTPRGSTPKDEAAYYQALCSRNVRTAFVPKPAK
jgi:hypothetical protein